MKHLSTPSEVIDAVGGTGAFAQWFGVTVKQVSAWRRRGFPAVTFLAMQARLKREHGLTAPPSAWNMIEPRQKVGA